jgi:hypothetical protein
MANVLDRNFDFATNGTVTAAGLHNLIDETNIYAGLISTQEERTSVGTGDLLLIANSSSIGSPQIAANRTTVYNLFEDALTGGTYVNAQLSGNLTYGTATGNRTISTSATITSGTIPNLTAGTTTSTAATITSGTITTGLIPTLTTGTTTSTAEIVTRGTIATLNSTTGTIATLNSTTGTIGTLNSTTGTINNLSTTLAGDFTISQGTGTLSTTSATLGTYGGSTSIPVLGIDAKGRILTASTSAFSSGKVLQVVQTFKNDVWTATSATAVDITGFSATITPSSTSNKILVQVSATIGGGADTYPYLLLLRNGTVIGSGTGATGNRKNIFIGVYGGTAFTGNSARCISNSYLDSPSSTSSLTYKLQMASPYNSGSMVLNRAESDVDAVYNQYATSSITLMEVAP